MSLRRVLFLCVFFLVLSLLIILEVAAVAEANPLTRGLPSQGEFDLSIQSPSNNTLSKNVNIPLNFTVNYTEQWNLKPYWCRTASIASIEVYLDGILSIQHISNQVDYYLNGTKTTYAGQNGPNNYSDWINQTSLGQHMLNVTANFSVQYHSNTMSWNEHEVISKIVYFTVEQQEPSASPMPPSTTDLLSNLMPILAIAAVIVIIVVASASLVYFKRKRGKP